MPFGKRSTRFSNQRKTAMPGKARSVRKAVANNYSKPVKSVKRTTRSGGNYKSMSLVALFKNFDFQKLKDYFKYLFTTREGLKKVGFVALIGFAVLCGLFLWFSKDLPSPDKINAKISAQSTQIFDRNGKLLYEIHGDQNRILASWDEIPKSVKEATLSIEDKNFYKHGGFDIFGIGRAVSGVLTRNSAGGGGSTITQQFVKNAILTNERSYTRKIKEIILSIEIEQMYKKDDILKMYLNEIPYGSNAYGIKVASKTFFNKDMKDLTIAESAVLAALPNAPTYYSPYGNNLNALLSRKDLIIDLMAEQKYITKDEAKAAKAEKVVFSTNTYGAIEAPHFVMYVKEKLVEKYGETVVNTGGLKVYTSLDFDKQKAAEEAVAKNVDKNLKSYKATNAGLVAMDPKTGQILAMVGSRDYFNMDIDGQVNIAVADRQPGSSFKPFAYATAWKGANWGPGSILYDVQTDFGGGYIPQNYSGGFWGPVSMRTALQNSLNIPAVKSLYVAGLKETIDTAHAMGITTLNDTSQYGLSLVLGAGEVKLIDMTNAYGVFANNGVKQDPSWFIRIEDSKGKLLDEYKTKTGKTVLDPQVAYMMNNVLSDDAARARTFGAGSALSLSGRPAGAKTGTTNSYKDAWTMGYTPSLVAGVWSGNNDGTPMSSGGGAFAAAPIWHDFMAKALAGTPVEQFKRPSGIKTVSIDGITGRKPGSSTKTSTDIFPSWYKIPDYNGQSSEVKINKLTGKKVNDTCPPTADNIEIRTIGAVTAEIPASDGAYSRWFAPIAAWAAANGFSTDVSQIETDTCEVVTAAPTVSIVSPTDGLTVDKKQLKVVLNVATTGTIKSVQVEIGKNTVEAVKTDSTYTATFPSATIGLQKVTATVTDSKGQTTTAVITITIT
jgi:1A family penicillin-binding protein